MKKIYIAIVLLIICSGVCIIEQVTINKVCSETTSIINTALYLNEQKDFLKAKSQCEKLRKIWSKRYPYLSAMIDHSQLDGAGAAIKATKDISKENEDELSENCLLYTSPSPRDTR